MATEASAKLVWQEMAILKAVSGTVAQRMERACIIVRDNVKVLSNRGNKDGKNPSEPGEPPKKVTGQFFRSVSYRVTQDADGNVVGLVGSNVPYQPRLELGFAGTDSRGRVYHQAPRPAFRPALENARPRIKQLFGIA